MDEQTMHINKSTRTEEFIGNKPKNVRTHNLKAVLSHFRAKEELSIQNIASAISISKTTATKLVNALAQMDLILSTGKGSSTEEGGKRPELFRLNEEYAYILSVTPTEDKIHIILCDLKFHIHLAKVYDNKNYEIYYKTLSKIAECIDETLQEAHLKPEQLCGISLGCEGIIEPENGMLHYSVHHNWAHHLPLREDFQKCLSFHVPVYLDNGCRNLARCEQILAVPSLAPDTAVIYADYFVGGCIIHNNQIQTGHRGFIGELGHVILHPESTNQYSYGESGSFGALVSTDTLIKHVQEIAAASSIESSLAPYIKDGCLTARHIFDAANSGDTFAQEALDPMIEHFAYLINNLIMFTDVQQVVIQGAYSQAGEYFLTKLQHTVDHFRFFETTSHIELRYSCIPSDAVINHSLLGGAFVAAEDFFSTIIT